MGPPGWDRDYSYTSAKFRAKRLATEATVALTQEPTVVTTSPPRQVSWNRRIGPMLPWGHPLFEQEPRGNTSWGGVSEAEEHQCNMVTPIDVASPAEDES